MKEIKKEIVNRFPQISTDYFLKKEIKKEIDHRLHIKIKENIDHRLHRFPQIIY